VLHLKTKQPLYRYNALCNFDWIFFACLFVCFVVVVAVVFCDLFRPATNAVPLTSQKMSKTPVKFAMVHGRSVAIFGCNCSYITS